MKKYVKMFVRLILVCVFIGSLYIAFTTKNLRTEGIIVAAMSVFSFINTIDIKTD